MQFWAIGIFHKSMCEWWSLYFSELLISFDFDITEVLIVKHNKTWSPDAIPQIIESLNIFTVIKLEAAVVEGCFCL